VNNDVLHRITSKIVFLEVIYDENKLIYLKKCLEKKSDASQNILRV
jgi:hypothetical protein